MKAYAAVIAVPSFSIGIECNADEITGIDYLEPCCRSSRRKRRWPKRPCASCAPGSPTRPSNSACRWHPPARISSAASGQRISAIPPGRTMSYGEVAAAIRSGPRAVGNACGANPYPIVVPCHRVVAANHGLGRLRAEFRRLPARRQAVAAAPRACRLLTPN
jgi:methylated-DNA-[protein]-cysteine S-methyltransferase